MKARYENRQLIHSPFPAKLNRCITSMQELYLGSIPMMDPMSLLDYPQVACGTGEVLISVEEDMKG